MNADRTFSPKCHWSDDKFFCHQNVFSSILIMRQSHINFINFINGFPFDRSVTWRIISFQRIHRHLIGLVKKYIFRSVHGICWWQHEIFSWFETPGPHVFGCHKCWEGSFLGGGFLKCTIDVKLSKTRNFSGAVSIDIHFKGSFKTQISRTVSTYTFQVQFQHIHSNMQFPHTHTHTHTHFKGSFKTHISNTNFPHTFQQNKPLDYIVRVPLQSIATTSWKTT